MNVGAVVVNHNAGASLSTCVDSLIDAAIDKIVVVDNDSRDDSLALLSRTHPNINIIRTGKNLGYGTAVNVGWRALDVDELFVCNPDLIVDKQAPRALASVLDDDPTVGVVGPRIFETNGDVYPSARAFPSVIDALGHGLFAMFWPKNPFSARYKLAAINSTKPTSVDWLSGACLMVRTAAFDAVGGFDESYFMYVEDLDLCWRMQKAGWTATYEPAASVVHQGGLSTARHPYRMLVAHHASTWRFARRSLTGPRRLMLPLVGFGISVRLIAAVINEFSRGKHLRANLGRVE